MFQKAGRAARRGARSTPGCADSHAHQVARREVIHSPPPRRCQLAPQLRYCCAMSSLVQTVSGYRVALARSRTNHGAECDLSSITSILGRHSHLVSDCSHDCGLDNSGLSTLVALSQTCLHCKWLFLRNGFPDSKTFASQSRSSLAHCITVCV